MGSAVSLLSSIPCSLQSILLYLTVIPPHEASSMIVPPPVIIAGVSTCNTIDADQLVQQRISYDRSTLMAIQGSTACPVPKKLRKNLFHNHIWGQHHGCPPSGCLVLDCPKISSSRIQVRVETRAETKRNQTGITWANLVVLTDTYAVADSFIAEPPSTLSEYAIPIVRVPRAPSHITVARPNSDNISRVERAPHVHMKKLSFCLLNVRSLGSDSKTAQINDFITQV